MATTVDLEHSTIFNLPQNKDIEALAGECREAATQFMNESRFWGKSELALWLLSSSSLFRRREERVPEVRLEHLQRIDDRFVDRLLANARAEVRRELDDNAASFASRAITSGSVMRCQDDDGKLGWTPNGAISRLADRVLALFAADYLTRPTTFRSGLSFGSASAEGDLQESTAPATIVMPKMRRDTLPFFPDSA